MSTQRYEAVPDSPPPSFRSRASSPSESHRDRIYTENDPLTSDADRELADTFDSPSDEEDEDGHDAGAERRLMGGQASTADTNNEDGNLPTQPAPQRRIERRVTQLPVFAPRTGRVYGGGNANDGVFSNLTAKPARGELEDEKPPVRSILHSRSSQPAMLTCLTSVLRSRRGRRNSALLGNHHPRPLLRLQLR
jgi:hypothetical protein